MKANPHLKAAILQVVNNQIKANDPPETKQTLDRLLSEGHSEEEAKRLIGCIVSSEIFDILKKQEESDRERFVGVLNALPKLPWE
jgi:peroxiredoxin family protein